MSQNEPQIRFPDDPVEVMNKKLDRFFWVLFSVGFVFVVTLLVMVITLLIDSFHFNAATYKEYSEKTESVDQTIKVNKELLNQNKENQGLILTLQKQIIDLLNKLPKSESNKK